MKKLQFMLLLFVCLTFVITANAQDHLSIKITSPHWGQRFSACETIDVEVDVSAFGFSGIDHSLSGGL